MAFRDNLVSVGVIGDILRVMHPAVRRGGAALEGRPVLPAVFEVIDEFVSIASATESNRSPFNRIRSSGHYVAHWREVGDQSCSLGHAEAIGGIGGNLRTILGPVRESISRVGGSR